MKRTHLVAHLSFPVLFALTGVLGVSEGHLLHGETQRVESGPEFNT